MSAPVMREDHAKAPLALLPDIPRGSTWTDTYKHQCLARYVANLPKMNRIRFFKTWERRHGRASAAALHEAAKAAYRQLSNGSRSAQP